VRAHVVTGPVSPFLAAVDRDAALALFDDVAHGSVRAALVDRTHRWAEDEPDAAASVSLTPEVYAPAAAVPAPPAAGADAQAAASVPPPPAGYIVVPKPGEDRE